MKKIMKRFTVFMVVCLAFLGAGTVALASAGYITWGGSDDYHLTIKLLDDIEQGIISKDEAIKKISSSNEQLTSSNEQLTSSNEQLTSSNEQLSSEVDTLKEEKTALNNKVNSLEEEKIALNNKVQDLEEDVENSTSDELIKQQLETLVKNTNAANGPKNKYDVLKEQINGYIDYYELPEKLGEHGKGESDHELEQAIEDMEEVRKKSEEVHSLLDKDENED